MLDRIKSEPALVSGFVQALLGLVIAFGLNLSPEQVGAILAVTAAGLALFVRSQVTPVPRDTNELGEIQVGLGGILAALACVALVLVILQLLGADVSLFG